MYYCSLMADNSSLIVYGGAVLVIGYLVTQTNILDKLFKKANEVVGSITDGINNTPLDDLEADNSVDTPNKTADSSTSQIAIATDFYAGKTAGLVASMANRNIYSATQIKQYILANYIKESQTIARLVGFKTTGIDKTNALALQLIARLVIKTSQSLRIELKPNDRMALEVISTLNSYQSTLPNSPQYMTLVADLITYLTGRFNNAVIPDEPKDENESDNEDENDNDDEDEDDV